MNLEKAFEPQRRKECKGKTICYPRQSLHLAWRLRAFAVNEPRFLR